MLLRLVAKFSCLLFLLDSGSNTKPRLLSFSILSLVMLEVPRVEYNLACLRWHFTQVANLHRMTNVMRQDMSNLIWHNALVNNCCTPEACLPLIRRVFLGYITVPMLFTVFLKFKPTFFPSNLMWIPNESKRIQYGLSFICKRWMFACPLLSEFTSLSLHPIS